MIDFDCEASEQCSSRRARANLRISGPRGADGLPDSERTLLVALRVEGIEIERGRPIDLRGDEAWRHKRIVRVEGVG